VENDGVTRIDNIETIERLLASGAARLIEIPGPEPAPAAVPGVLPFTHLGHALQTAAVLRQQVPDDVESAVAGLVHAIGHLLPGIGDAEHAVAVRST